MRFRLQPWQSLILLAIAIAALLYGIDSYRHRFVRNEGDLLSLLPARTETVFFVDVAALRRAGLLRLLAGAKPAKERDYDTFVQAAGLDYTRDLDSLAGATDTEELFFTLRGRFDWDRLREYVRNHGGSCPSDFCEIATSQPERWASFLRIQPDVIGLAVSRNRRAAEALRPPGKRSHQPAVNEPVWVSVSRGSIRRLSLVPGIGMFAQALASAEEVVLALTRAQGNEQNALNLLLQAAFADEASAEAARNQLRLDTKLLKLELARERRRPNPGDLTGLLTSGSFEVVNRQVVGVWPIRKELLANLQ
ncbi:MAG: hypothetical protein JO138_04740 [Acidobacteriaceae bacterium]|nr:hypothetical protein [Acidobacteriaceae bacterium]